VTSAKDNHVNLSFSGFCELLKNGNPYLLVLGTAWGLSEGIIASADYVLDSVTFCSRRRPFWGRLLKQG
jgi:hypothetical protein